MPENGSCRRLKRDIQRQSVNLAARLCGRQTSPSAGESFATSGRTPSSLPAPDYWHESGVRHCVYCLSANVLFRYPGQRQCSARPGFPSIVIRVSGIENCHPGFSRVYAQSDYPPTAYAFPSRPTSCTALFQPDVTAGYIAFVDRHQPSRENCAVSSAILSCIHLPATASGRCHPPGARRDHCLTTLIIAQIHTHLHHAVLSGKAERLTRPSARCRRGSFSQVSWGSPARRADRMASGN